MTSEASRPTRHGSESTVVLNMQRWRLSIHFAPVKDVPDLATGL